MSKLNPNALIGLDNKDEIRAIEYGSNQLNINNRSNKSKVTLQFLLILSFMFCLIGFSACKSDEEDGSNLSDADKINSFKYHTNAKVICDNCNTTQIPSHTMYKKEFAPDKGRIKYVCNECGITRFYIDRIYDNNVRAIV